jgi:hypothetical protein
VRLLYLVFEVIIISSWLCLVLALSHSVILASVGLTLVRLFVDKQEIFVHNETYLDISGKELDPFIFLFEIIVDDLWLSKSEATTRTIHCCFLLIFYSCDESIASLCCLKLFIFYVQDSSLVGLQRPDLH